ncbi:MAG TPA: glycosyltransferase [Ignavibacteria bacterium]|nr:glycosyltransferase [Ignavibacteria bacterium]
MQEIDFSSGNAVISIIIPTLNEEKLILKTLSQFTPEIKKKYSLELIISDGGSDDKTIELVNGLTDVVDKITIHNVNRKQNISEGRNKGAQISKGDVLIFFNADTCIKDIELFFSKVIEIFKSSDVSAIACPVYVFPEEEILIDKLFHAFYNNYTRLINKLKLGMGRGEAHIVRRDVYLSQKGYNEKLFAGEDYDFYKRIGRNGKIKFSKDLIIFESPRRYRKFGYFKVFMDWYLNSIYVTFFNKSSSDVWEQVR